MDEYNIYEGAFSGPQIDSILGNSTRQDAIAIVSSNNTHIAITAGQYVYVKSHGTLADGLYKANSNIQANGTLTTSNLTAVSNGVANELKAALATANITSDFTTDAYLEANNGTLIYKVGNLIVVSLAGVTKAAGKPLLPIPNDYRPEAGHDFNVGFVSANGTIYPLNTNTFYSSSTLFSVENLAIGTTIKGLAVWAVIN